VYNICVWGGGGGVGVYDDDIYPPETLPHTPGQHGHSPQRQTVNTVPQRANPTQTAYTRPRRGTQTRGQRLGTWTLVRPQKSRCAYSAQWYPREIGTSTITVPDGGLRPGFRPPISAGVSLRLNPRRCTYVFNSRVDREIFTVGIISRDHVPGHLLLPFRRGDDCGGGVNQFYGTPLKYKRRAKRTSCAD